MYRIVLLIGGSLLFAGCNSKKNDKVSVLPYYNTADFTPMFLTAAEAEKKINHHIADFTFTDQDSQIVTQKTVAGKIHVANFFFTGCGSICPKMMSNLKQAWSNLNYDSNIVFLSYSVTPWTDSVPKLKTYAENESIKSPWHLLTGTKAAIYDLARTSYFAEEDLGFSKDSTNFLHTEHILLIDKTKRIRGIYNGTLQLETDQLVKDITSLKAEE